MNKSSLYFLTDRNKEFCTYTGVFGVLLSLTCLIQHFVIAIPHWVTFMVTLVYLFTITSFALLALQKAAAPVMLIISSVLVFMTEAFLMITGLFSLVVILLFIYCIVITIVVYMDGIPKKLSTEAAKQRAERNEWVGKI